MKLPFNRHGVYEAISFLKLITLPIILLVATGAFLYAYGGGLGGAGIGLLVGVLLGFTVDMLKRGLDQFSAGRRLRVTARRLLEQDARDVFRATWLYESLLASNSIDKEIKARIPPRFKLRYWTKLKNDNQFLLLAAEANFQDIFNAFFDIEEINDQIERAEKGDRQGYMFARGFYQAHIKQKSHADLLGYFIGRKGVESFESGLKKQN